MEIPGGGGGSTMKPLGKENPGGWGVKLGKTLHGVWIFSGTTHLCIKYSPILMNLRIHKTRKKDVFVL